jgi:hypothetical protein
LPGGPEHAWLQRWRQWLLAGAGTAFAVFCIVAGVILHLPLEGSAANWVAIFGFTLIDLVAARIILEAIHPGSALARTLSVRPLRSLGVISYAFYVYRDLLHDCFAYFGDRFSPNHAFLVITISASQVRLPSRSLAIECSSSPSSSSKIGSRAKSIRHRRFDPSEPRLPYARLTKRQVLRHVVYARKCRPLSVANVCRNRCTRWSFLDGMKGQSRPPRRPAPLKMRLRQPSGSI